MEGSLISSHGERSTPGASSSTSMSSFAAPLPKVMPVQKGAPRPKGGSKSEKFTKKGSSIKRDPDTKGSTAKSLIIKPHAHRGGGHF